jgi:hypothetical protein
MFFLPGRGRRVVSERGLCQDLSRAICGPHLSVVAVCMDCSLHGLQFAWIAVCFCL